MIKRDTNHFAILLNGDFSPSATVKASLTERQIIAADGGIRHALVLDVQPNLWIGDFDSSDHSLLKQFQHIERFDFPTHKVASDGELAVEEAIKHGAKDILLIGALGGERTDHMLFHMTKALALANSGTRIALTDGLQLATPLVSGTQIAPFSDNEVTFSIVGLSALQGLTITNAKWALDSVNVPLGSTLTLSNIGYMDTLIELSKGDAFLFTQFKR